MPQVPRSFRVFEAFALLLAVLAPVMLRAQGAPAQDSGTPERGVARISVIDGDVSVRRGDSGDWVAAGLNAPLMAEDRLATGPGARAEVQFDSANMIRVGANAEIRLAHVAYGRYTVQVAHGTVMFRVLRDTKSQVELQTPPVSVRPTQVGAYRVYVREDGQTEITVRLGLAEIYSPHGTEQLQVGQTMLARGNPADPEFQIGTAIAKDQWDEWNEQRDREMLSSDSYRNVPQDVYGAEDLDKNGRWVDVPSYGQVWSPTVNADWAPYQNGRWVWEDYYGWTWVSYDPWGWAPFHYGRWLYAAPYGWCWHPGGFGRHYWSPALVAFFGFGPGVGAGFGFGNVGWLALAPYEPLYPWWGRGYAAGFRGAGSNRGINIANVSITNIYRNARGTNGVVSVNSTDFRQGRFTNISHVSTAQIHEAGLVRGQLPVAPTNANLRYANHAVAYTPRSTENVRFFGHTTVSPSNRVPFSEQQRVMQQYSRQPVTAAHGVAASPNGGWRSATIAPSHGPLEPGSVSPGTRAASTRAWRPATPATSTPAARDNGWLRFGEPRAAAPAVHSYSSEWTAPRPEYAQPGAAGYRPYQAPAAASGNRPQSIRVAPPVVKERPAPRTDSGSHASHSTPSSPRSSGGSHR
jgi:hypothetical protein